MASLGKVEGQVQKSTKAVAAATIKQGPDDSIINAKQLIPKGIPRLYTFQSSFNLWQLIHLNLRSPMNSFPEAVI